MCHCVQGLIHVLIPVGASSSLVMFSVEEAIDDSTKKIMVLEILVYVSMIV